MNKTNWTIDGGLEAVQEVFKHNQDGIIEAFANMLKNTGTGAANGVKLFGCDVTLSGAGNNTGAVTAGAVYIDGEIYTVDAASGIVKTGSDDFVFKVVETTASPTLDYFDATTNDPLLVRKAALSFEPNATSGNFMPYNADTWQERLHGKQLTGGVTYGTDGGGGTLSAINADFRYQHDFEAKRLYVEGRFAANLGTANTAYITITLPVDRDGNQIKAVGTSVHATGTAGGDVVRITANLTNPEVLEVRKINGSNFTTGTLPTIRFNFSCIAYNY